jgi:acyl-coenzyme A thioesterase PaaI-like protein
MVLKFLHNSKNSAMEYLLNNESIVGRNTILSKLLNKVVPFNAPHGFTIQQITADQVRVTIPSRRSNWNHLNTVHACAIATLGEMVAGLAIIKTLGIIRYRLILKSLTINYAKQATTDLEGIASLLPEEWAQLQAELNSEHQSSLTINSKIYNTKSELVAQVESCWQLKEWDHVTFKSI